jgi:hypothetical protein
MFEVAASRHKLGSCMDGIMCQALQRTLCSCHVPCGAVLSCTWQHVLVQLTHSH